MLRASATLAVSCLLAACATNRDVYLADGSLGHNISCNGHIQNFSSCLQMAGDICGARGYVVMNQRGEPIPPPESGAYTASAVAAQGGIETKEGVIITRSLMVRCR